MTMTHEPDRVHELEAKVAELTALVERLTPAAAPAVAEENMPRSSRRGMLKLAGAVAAGAAATVVTKGGDLAANDSDPLKIGESNTTTAANRSSTVLVYGNTTDGPEVNGVFLGSKVDANMFTVRDTAGGFVLFAQSGSDYPAAIGGYSYRTTPNGIYGYTSQSGAGVVGVGVGSTGVGLRARGTRAGLSIDALGGAPATRSTLAFLKGDVIEDTGGNLWVCVADGTPGTWRKLAGPATAGAYHAITPTRVYDSRAAEPSSGALSAGGTRTLSVKDGRSLETGAVTAADLVPAGATAVSANVTVVNTVGAGFLAINPGGNTTVAAATVNWFGTGQILNNGVNLTLDASRQVTVIAGGGTTDFVIDVTGYFL